MGRVFTSQTIITPPPVDASTSAWVTAVNSNGGGVSGARRLLVDALITGLKSDNVWPILDRLWIFAAENEPQALTDLVVNDLATAVNAPTFIVDVGYAGNGTNKYIDTTYNASTDAVNFALNSAHISGWDNTSHAFNNTPALMGARQSGITGCVIQPFINFGGPDLFGFSVNLNSLQAANNSNSQGHFIATRTATNLTTGYFNGVSKGTDGSPTSGIANFNFFACGQNSSGSLTNGTTDQVCMISMGGGMNATFAAMYYNRLRTHMTALGVP